MATDRSGDGERHAGRKKFITPLREGNRRMAGPVPAEGQVSPFGAPTLLSPAPSPIWPAITHAGVRRRAGKNPARFRSGLSKEGFACGVAPEEGTLEWRFLNSPCDSCSRLAPTSATRLTAGTRG